MSRELLVAPDWERPEGWIPALAAFVAAAPPASGARLWLETAGSPLPGSLLVQMIGEVCEWASRGDDFAEVVVADGPSPERPAARRVAGAADVLGALGADQPPAPADAAAVVARAREAKRLADRVTAMRDRWRFETAPDPWASPEPLVSVRIPTWRGHELLVSRAIPSALRGSYANIEVVVCSDGPDPAARAAVAAVGDPRVRYVEVPRRPVYASHFQSFWMTAGSMSANGALDACRGDFIAPLDHDDAFTQDHVHELLGAARATGADFVYGQGACETREGPWTIIGSAPLELGRITHGSVLHSARLAHMRFDPHCWLLDEPGDWNLWRRMSEAGAVVAHLPRVVFVHFKEKTSIEARDGVTARDLGGPVAVGDEDLARDVLGTGARWLLDVPRRAAAGVPR
ncbi:glycosyltransferase family 2 protein [Miltoncostaea marina]|uniref:glycosyltransferase family 2 protein n=1 Tax=Miltoncostaea marina TaxID=2843215 RepID=UPI001C3CC3FE|nr:glycosyltransferase [Miltoncostaea marina]